MNRYIDIFLFVSILLVIDSVKAEKSIEELVPQIKVKRIQIWTANPAYVERLSYKIVKHNATFNDVIMDMVLKVNLPNDVYLQSTVHTTDSEYKNENLLLLDNVPLCMDNPDHHLLPEGFIVPDSELKDGCFTKNRTVSKVLNNFRFDVLTPNIHNISDYHTTNLVLRSKNDVITNSTFYSEWGYLNTD